MPLSLSTYSCYAVIVIEVCRVAAGPVVCTERVRNVALPVLSCAALFPRCVSCVYRELEGRSPEIRNRDVLGKLYAAGKVVIEKFHR